MASIAAVSSEEYDCAAETWQSRDASLGESKTPITVSLRIEISRGTQDGREKYVWLDASVVPGRYPGSETNPCVAV
jgi:hypothetical protein